MRSSKQTNRTTTILRDLEGLMNWYGRHKPEVRVIHIVHEDFGYLVGGIKLPSGMTLESGRLEYRGFELRRA